MKEMNWDTKLHIRTSGRDDSRADNDHHPYEPTPYKVLERLTESVGLRSCPELFACGWSRDLQIDETDPQG